MGKIKAVPPFSKLVAEGYYCHLDLHIRPRKEIVVSCAGRERCLPAYHVERSGYECYAMEFVAEGEGRLTLKGERFKLSPGHLFVYGPRISHRMTSDARRPMVKYFVNFFGQSVQQLFHPKGIRPGQVIRVFEIEAMRHLFEEMIREGRKEHEHARLITRSYLELLFLKSREAGSAGSRSSSRALETFQRCRQVIERKFAELSGLEDLSKQVGVDPSHICRLFRHFGQDSPHASLIRSRMHAAAELLATSTDLVKEVAAAVGYDDALHFSRLFRKQFGCSPQEFRLNRS